MSIVFFSITTYSSPSKPNVVRSESIDHGASFPVSITIAMLARTVLVCDHNKSERSALALHTSQEARERCRHSERGPLL